MGEMLHAGIYTQEVPSGKVTPAGVSTSNGAFVGFTPRGPVNDPDVVTNWTQFVAKYGSFDSRSELPTHVYAFFANGGKRAYINRCVGAGAAKAAGNLANPVEEELMDVGDGVTLAFTGAFTYNPLRASAGGISVRYRPAGAPVVGQASDLSPTPNGVATEFVGKLGLLGADTPVVPGSITITDLQGPAPSIVYNDDGLGGLEDAAAPGVTVGYVSYVTGHFSLRATAAPLIPGDVSYAYTPKGAVVTVTDDGAGAWAGGIVGAINYTTGVWSVTFASAPALGENIIADYTQDNVPFEVAWEGLDGNDVSVVVSGDPNYYTPATAVFTRYKLQVWQVDDDDVNQLRESFDQLSLTDTTDPHYLLTIVNNEDTGSDLIDLSAMTDNVGPFSLNGLARTRAISAGNGIATQFGSSGATPTINNPFVTGPLEFPVARGSVSITYEDTGGTARVIVDDGEGNLTGASVDPAAAAGFNVIDYATGQFAFQVLLPVGNVTQAAARSIVSITYAKDPSDASVTDDPTGGLDGTLPLTRNELTNPNLKADREGIYAFLKVNEMMNLVVPDALNAASAAKITMFNDITTECADPDNGRWFAIFCTPEGLTPIQAQRWRLNTYAYTKGWAALYYPWIKIADPITDLIRTFPPGGHIAGIMANSDVLANVGTGPAGITRASLNFCSGVERKMEWSELDIVQPYEINPIIDTPQTGRVVWGARTLERPRSDYSYIHARRLVTFIRVSIFESTHGFVFENVGASLWARIKAFADGFLGNLYKNNYFGGDTPVQAFFVICDETNNSIDDNHVYCDVGVRPHEMAEMIVFRITQITKGSV
jgi:hypothetical protein